MDYYAGKPRHTQLMDPIEDPEEYIRSSIYWHPLISPSRTEVLEHLFLTNGNGYEWDDDGQIRSVFSHIPPEPDEDFPYKYEQEIRKAETDSDPSWAAYWGSYQRERLREELAIRDDYEHRARTYGPIRTVIKMPDGPEQRMITSWDLSWTLLGQAPANADPKWKPYMDEVRELFAPILIEQGTLF